MVSLEALLVDDRLQWAETDRQFKWYLRGLVGACFCAAILILWFGGVL